MTRELKYPEIGKVCYISSSRAKYVKIAVTSSGVISVIVPKGVSIERAEEFLMSRKKWILGVLTKYNTRISESLSPQWNTEIEYPRIGKVIFVRSSKARRINISLRQVQLIKVTAPHGVEIVNAEQFLLSKEKWIEDTKKKLSARQIQGTEICPETGFSTRFHKMIFIAEVRKNIHVGILQNIVEVRYPDYIDFQGDLMKKNVQKAIEFVWKKEANDYLPQRIKYLANLHSFTYSHLQIKNTRSFWGKCYSDKRVTLSIHLMHLPDHLIDYVILHELCHTIHLNHGSGFWKLMDKVCDNKARDLAKEMKQHSTRMY